jgi:hypothetical protein
LIENILLGVSGNLLAFPVASGMEEQALRALNLKPWISRDELITDDYVEQILSFPTRGIFAEAKLGHCNASELIDPTRFWDWQTSPIPDDAPAIAPIETGTRNAPMQGTTPTAFPPSLINIVNPTNLPDPTGLAAGASVLGALGPFRDMSGMKELGAYLQDAVQQRHATRFTRHETRWHRCAHEPDRRLGRTHTRSENQI